MTQDSNDPGTEKPLRVVIELTPEQTTRIDDLLDRWSGVQGRLKKAEQISQIAVIPAINELRYAGRMLVAAMSNTQPTTKNGLPSVDDAIVTAGQYITNAEHDIADALVYFYQKKADDLNARFGAQTIRVQFDRYDELLSLLKQSRNLVISSRAKFSDRQKNYKELIEVTEKLNDLYFLFVDADVLFGLEVAHYQARIKLWKSASFLAAAVIVAGVLIVLL